MKLNEPDSGLPRVRILHQLGRSGGTIISRCLAVMDGTLLLSEVHPYINEVLRVRCPDIKQYLPLVQAEHWFNLTTSKDHEELEKQGLLGDFVAEIALIHQRCTARGERLVIRDFNNLDFAGINYHASPPFRFTTFETLQERFGTFRFFTVRHPANQWASLTKLFTEDPTPMLQRFLLGFRLFAEHAADVGFVRYEDFTRHLERELKSICEALELPYDPTWQARWAGYKKITGDIRARTGKSEISPPRRNVIEPGLLHRLRSNADYRKSLELLGYQDAHA